MSEIYGAEAVVRVLQEEGVTCLFGVQGHAIMPLISAACSRGIKYYSMRHEQAASFAADGWARAAGQVGVCCSTAAPGMMNLLPGICQANLCMSPVVALIGSHEMSHDKLWPMQECYPADVCKSMTKWTQRVLDWGMHSYYIRRAFLDALTYPPGPIVLDFPWNTLLIRGEDEQQKYVPRDRLAKPTIPWGDPDAVEMAVSMLWQAEKPLIVAGDGIYWAKAGKELKELSEFLRIPVHIRRMGRGAVPEKHPLAVSGGERQPLLDAADVILLVGVRASFLDEWFEPPLWNHQARYIQVQEAPTEIFIGLPTEMAICGGHKAVLEQMLDYAKARKKEVPKREGWLEELKKIKERHQARLRESANRVRVRQPLHVHFLCQEIADFLDDTAMVILDSAVGSSYLTDRIQASFAGQVLDSGLHQGVGHGVGMSIGAQLAKPGKQILVMIGDGGLGVGGMDIETARRYNLPIVYLVCNNSSWGGNYMRELLYPEVHSWNFLPDIRYDKMFEPLGCHVANVTRPEELRPALERAFKSGITSVVNVMVEDSVILGVMRRIGLIDTWSKQSQDRLPPEGRDWLAKLTSLDVARAHKILKEMGIRIPLESLERITHGTQ